MLIEFLRAEAGAYFCKPIWINAAHVETVKAGEITENGAGKLEATSIVMLHSGMAVKVFGDPEKVAYRLSK